MTTDVYTERIGEVLRERFGDRRFAAKRVAGMAEGNERAAQNWISGTCGPQVRALLLLMAREPAIAEAVQGLVEQQRELDAQRAQLRTARDRVAR